MEEGERMPAGNPTSSLPYRLFIALVVILGWAMVVSCVVSWESADPVRWAFFLLLGLVASGMKLNLPQTFGTISANFVFVLLGVLELSLSETLLLACTGTAVQMLVHRHAAQLPLSTAFHVGSTAIAVTIGYHIYHWAWAEEHARASLLTLAFVSSVMYAMNTLPVALAAAIVERRSVGWVWRECNFRGFPYYIGGALLAALVHYATYLLDGQPVLLLVPLAFLVYCSYYSYQSRASEKRVRDDGAADLHQRTIEALAMAIEAKDQTSHLHLKRLQLYCAEVGTELGLTPPEMEALRAAAVLHDIGKLAVPEHILSKAGRLTREEFEKVKIHPVVGAEVLERVNFPYPVAAVVRCHHEKWNGLGYPLGLKGEDIPIGARILAVADTLDSLISERPYRPAVNVEEAVNRVSAEAGLSFDPKVVKVFERVYLGIEARLQAEEEAARPPGSEKPSRQTGTFRALSGPVAPPSTDDVLSLQRASQQNAGPSPADDAKPAFLDTIAAARQEAQVLLELTQELGSSLHLDETLAGLANGLRRMMAFETMVIYVQRDNHLAPRYASGEMRSLFLSTKVPLGAGVVGTVFAMDRPEMNEPPDMEVGGVPSDRPRVMESSIAVPLPGAKEVRGVLMLASRSPDAFGKDQLRILMGLSAKLGVVIENALKYEQATASATTDFLTGLPNARALDVQLENEIARSRRNGTALAVLVTDLDGFKEVNDRFGHQEGDTVLRAVGRVLRETCRDYDYVARLGGDEFVILLPGLGEDDVKSKTDQFAAAVSAAAAEAVPGARVGLSVGKARFPEDGDHPAALRHIADQRMYEVKQYRKRSGSRGFAFDTTEVGP
jgi:diguanylate cyclase (GGDEF)-like protein/putative nucleotidyltransferase with HDIG domain